MDLYIDESGRSYIGEPEFKFFLLTALIISPDQNHFATQLFKTWRDKYLKDPLKCIHAYDFFEDHTENYRRQELVMGRNFKKAVDDLKALLELLNFSAEMFYVDIERLRILKGIRKPPIKPAHPTSFEKQEYTKNKKLYNEHIKSILSNKQQYLPLILPLSCSFSLHNSILDNTQGYINIESQSTSDTLLIETFHSYSSRTNDYNDKILGVNFHNKKALDGGLELADLISYISFQRLRSQFNRTTELKGIDPIRLEYIRKLRTFMREKFKIKITDVTEIIYP